MGLPAAVSRAMRVALVVIALASAPVCPCSICKALVASLFAASAVKIMGSDCWPGRPKYWLERLRLADIQTGSGDAQPRANARLFCAVLNSFTQPFSKILISLILTC